MKDPTTGKVDSSIWIFTGLIFAATMIGFVGMFHALTGVTALLGGGYFDTTDDYPFRINLTLWGILQIVFGGICIAAAVSIFSGRTWAIIFGIVIAAISAVGSFLSIPYHAVWSTIIIVIDMFIIYTLAVYGRVASDET